MANFTVVQRKAGGTGQLGNWVEQYLPGGGVTAGVTGTVGGRRQVLLQVTGSFFGSVFAPGLSLFRNEPDLVRQALNANEWTVSSVIRTSTNLLGIGAYTFQVAMSVDSGLSDGQLTGRVAMHLSSLMSGISISIINANASYINQGGTTTTVNPPPRATDPPDPNYTPPAGGDPNAKGIFDQIGDMFGPLFTPFGIGAATGGIIVAGIVFYLAVKK